MLLIDLLHQGSSINVNKYLILAIGLDEAVLFCELLSRHKYFENKEQLDDEGFFYNTIDDLHCATGLGEKPQKTGISKLKSEGLIQMKLKLIPAKRHFKIIATDELLLSLIKKGKEKIKEIEGKSIEKAKKRLASTENTSVSPNGRNLHLPNGETRISQKEKQESPFGSTNNTNINKKKDSLITTTTHSDSTPYHTEELKPKPEEPKPVVVEELKKPSFPEQIPIIPIENELQTEIESVVQAKIYKAGLNKLRKEVATDIIQKYIQYWPRFEKTELKTKEDWDNRMGIFINVCKDQRLIPLEPDEIYDEHMLPQKLRSGLWTDKYIKKES